MVLGGGRSRRMGRDKMGVLLDGRPLLRRTVDAALSWAEHVVVVAPEPEGWEPDLRVSFTLEDPPFGGPVAGIAAAVAVLVTDKCGQNEIPAESASRNADRRTFPSVQALLLAGDLAAPQAVVRQLDAAEPGPDGVVLRDEDGWPQYLAGRYRLGALVSAVEALGGTRDVSVRRALSGLDLAQVDAPSAVTKDLDTPEDLAEVAEAR
ncbi:MAG TPA: NTP transferase domain-containing protein [Arachnia sp.]|nr:NTP transferase domain-containing protein [Arachnia sp.]HMT86784.1 NTP transferase domain-containing protein [Arachnia sp.]